MFYVTNQLYYAYGFPESRGINITYTLNIMYNVASIK